MEIKFKRPKSKREIIALPFVDEMFNEGEDGWWIHLKEGYRSMKMECGLIHEDTVSECINSLMEGVEKI